MKEEIPPGKTAEEIYKDRIAVGGNMHFNNHFNIIAMAEEYANQRVQGAQTGMEVLKKLVDLWEQVGGEACDWDEDWIEVWKEAKIITDEQPSPTQLKNEKL